MCMRACVYVWRLPVLKRTSASFKSTGKHALLEAHFLVHNRTRLLKSSHYQGPGSQSWRRRLEC